MVPTEQPQSGRRSWLLPAVPVLVVLIGALLRLLLVGTGWPRTDADEATMGLMALHIAQGRHFPSLFYGQAYMGTLEAYLAAPWFVAFGPSLFGLRAAVILLNVAFVVSMYLFARLVYGNRIALWTVLLLALALIPVRVVKAVGYAEILLFGSLVFLLAAWLASSGLPSRRAVDKKRRLVRLAGFGGWGLAAGLGLWSNLLVAPYVAASGVLLAAFCWREVRSAGWCVVLGVLVGAAPLLVFNLSAAPQQRSWATLRGLQQSGGAGAVATGAPLAQRATGTVLVSIPYITGATAVCPQHVREWPVSGESSPYAKRCIAVAGVWTGIVLTLLTVAVGLAGGRLFAHWARARSGRSPPADDHHTVIRDSTTIALLAATLTTLALFVASPAPALVPREGSRYLLGLWIALPAVLWPLWIRRPARQASRPSGTRLLRLIMAAALAMPVVVGTVATVWELPVVRAADHQRRTLIGQLLSVGADRVYSDYWSCAPLIFSSRERIICSVLDERLRPGFDRYLPYRDLVAAERHPTYLFPETAPQSTLIDRLAQRCGWQRERLQGYMVVRPGRVGQRVPPVESPSVGGRAETTLACDTWD